MASVLGSTQAVLEGSLHLNNSSRFAGLGRSSKKQYTTGRQLSINVRAQAQADSSNTSRRSVLGLVATTLASGSFVQAVLADPKSIKLGAPPPPSGGLPGTLNSDEARDLDLPLSNRFFLQALPPVESLVRAKESKDDILKVKSLIDKKAWPYVQNDLRLKAGYLRFDLRTVISSKSKDEKKMLKELENTVYTKLDELDYAAKMKSSTDAVTSYAASKSALDDLFAKLG